MKKLLLLCFIVSQCSIHFAQQIPSSSKSSNPEEIRFIVFGDSQFGNPPEFERMIYEANLLRPTFVIQVGDLIHGYTHDKDQLRSEWKRFKNQISPLTAPFYPVPGNHDIVTDEAEEVYADIWGKDKYNYSFNYNHVHCIVLNSWHGNEDDRIAEWQYNWLQNELKKINDLNNSGKDDNISIFVFLHSPLWKYPSEHNGFKDWQKVHNLLKEYPVKLVAAGHSHEYVWENKDGIDYLIINSAGVRKVNLRAGIFSSFLHVSALSDGDIRYATIKAGSILPLDTVTPEERKEVSSFIIPNKTLRINNQQKEQSVYAEIKNTSNENRLYNLQWSTPFNSSVNVSPYHTWIEADTNSSVLQKFAVRKDTDANMENIPSLQITSERNYRSGFVSREDEKKFKISKDGFTTSIPLTHPIKFTAEYSLFAAPTVTARVKLGEIIIDGKFDEKDWIVSTGISKFNQTNNESPEVETNIKFIYDTDYLYVAAKMEEPNPDKMQSTAVPPIPFTWNDDDLELFFDTRNNQKDYIRLFQNSFGVRFSSFERWVEDKYFKSEYESAIFIGENYWTLEMKIPWNDIGISEGPKANDKWGLNIGRHRQQSKDKEFRWAGNLYNPQKYGIINFE